MSMQRINSEYTSYQKNYQQWIGKPCGVRVSATTKTRHVILDFDIVSEIIIFEQKGRFGKKTSKFGCES